MHIVDTPSAGVGFVSASDGGSWNGSTIEWTIPQIASGESLTLTYVMTMPADLDPAAQTVMSNNVAVDATGLPGDVDGERTFSLTDSADVTVGLPGPAISKVSEFDVTPIGQANVNEVSITIPAGGPYFDVLVWDEIPDGVSFDGGLSLSCSSGCTGSDPAPIELSSFTSPAGFTRIGYFLGDVPASTSDRVYVLKYRISIKETDVDGNEPTLGEIFTNVAHVGFNAVDRSGAVTPNLSVPPASDASAVATDDVEYNRPVLNISKVANVASPVDLDPNAAVTYTIEVCNSGGVDANNVMVKDVFAPSGNIGQLWAITSSTSYVSISSSSSPGMFYVSTVPADGCTSFTYEVRFDGSLGSPTSNNEASVVELSDPVGNQYDTSDIAPAVATFAILSPDLVIEKTAVNPIQSTSDTTIDWTISITNNGTGTAYNVTVNDPFPTGVIKQKTTTPNWSDGSEVFTYGLPIPPGETVTLDLESIGEFAPGTIVNTAEVEWTDGAGNTGTDFNGVHIDWTDSDDASVEAFAPSVTILKTPDLDDDPTPYIVEGTDGTFLIRLINDGMVPLENITLLDALPPTLGYTINSAYLQADTPARRPYWRTRATALRH